MILNSDYKDMLSALFAENAEFMVVGAYAMAAHGLPRATGDIDIWIRATPPNAKRVWQAINNFGCPLFDLKMEELNKPDIVFQIGVAPRRIDILTSIDGVDFDDAWPHRVETEMEGMKIPTIGRSHLIKNKRAARRPKDIADIAWLDNDDSCDVQAP